MGLNWNFQRGGGIQTKKPSVGGVWIFSGTTQFTTGFGFTSDWLGKWHKLFQQIRERSEAKPNTTLLSTLNWKLL